MPGNQLWSINLDVSNASPIKIGDRLYCTEDPSTLLCIDAQTGEILWKSENDHLNLLGLSEEELANVKETLAKSDEMNRKVDRLTYEMNRIELRANKTDSWDKWKPIFMEKFYTFQDLQKEMKAFTESSPYSEVITPTTQNGNGYASYAPTSDGEFIYTSFGTGVVVAHDLEGNRIWHQQLNHPDHGMGGSTFPVLAGDVLVVRFSDYVGLDKTTGEELWRTPSVLTFGTPVTFQVEDEHYLFTARGGLIRARDGLQFKKDIVAYDEETGFLEAFNSPLVQGDKIYFTQGAHVAPEIDAFVSAFRIPKVKYELEIYGLECLWKTQVQQTSFFSSPLEHDGLVYTAGRDKVLTVFDAKNGEVVYSQRIDKMRDAIFSSLTLAGDAIFFGNEEGLAIFIEPGRKYRELARNKISLYRSTPIFEASTTYVRTWNGLQAYRKGTGSELAAKE